MDRSTSNAARLLACLALASGSGVLRAQAPSLVEAVKAGDRAVVQRLVRQGARVTTAEADGTTPLHWAVRADDPAMVQALLAAGADADAANRYGVTPLALAALGSRPAIVGALLKAGANPNAPLAEGQTVLMAAARAGDADTVGQLLEANAAVNAHEQVLGETALMWAAMENHPEVVAQLAARGADVNARSAVTSFSRYRFGDGIVARPTVLPRGGWTALMYAARQNAVDGARALVEAGADADLTDPDGTTALVFAVINGHYDLAALLLERGADPNVADSTGMAALYAAVDMHTLDEIVGRPNPTPHSAIDEVELMRRMLARGADPNARLTAPVLERQHNDGDTTLGKGATPLMRAAKDADVAAMRVLLDAGADLGASTATGRTPLMFAAGRLPGFRGTPNRGTEQDALKAVTLCLDRGADVNAVDQAGQSAFHLAVALGEDSVVTLLAARGADVGLKDRQGRTPLDVLRGGGRGGRPVNQGRIALVQGLMGPAASPTVP